MKAQAIMASKTSKADTEAVIDMAELGARLAARKAELNLPEMPRNAGKNRIGIKIGNAVAQFPFRRKDPIAVFQNGLQALKGTRPLHDKLLFRFASKVYSASGQLQPGGGFPFRRCDGIGLFRGGVKYFSPLKIG